MGEAFLVWYEEVYFCCWDPVWEDSFEEDVYVKLVSFAEEFRYSEE